MTNNTLGQPLGHHVDRTLETVSTEDQSPTQEVLALSQCDAVVLGRVAVRSGVLAKRQYDHPKVASLGADRQAVDVPSRTDRLKTAIADRDTVLAVSRSSKTVHRVVGRSVEMVGKQIRSVVVDGRESLGIGFLPLLVQLNLLDNQVGIRRSTDPLRVNLDPEHRPGLGLELVHVLVASLLQRPGDVAGDLDCLGRGPRVVGLGLDGHRAGSEVDRYRIGDSVCGLQTVFERIESRGEWSDTVPDQGDARGLLGDSNLDGQLLQFATGNADPRRLTAGQVTAV